MINVLRKFLLIFSIAILSNSTFAALLTRSAYDMINGSPESKSIPTAASAKETYKYNRSGYIYLAKEEENDRCGAIYTGDGSRFASFDYACASGYKFTGVTVYAAFSGDNTNPRWHGSHNQMVELVYGDKVHKPSETYISASVKGWTGRKFYFTIPFKDNIDKVQVRFKASSSDHLCISHIKLDVAPLSATLTNNLLTIIDHGRIVNCWLRGGDVQKKNGYIEFSGQGALALGQRAMDKGNLSIFAKLELKKSEQTAASFYFNGNNFGFDGGGNAKGKCFLEGPDIKPKGYQLADLHIKPGVPFIFEMKRTGANLEFFIDGKKVGATKTDPLSPVFFGLRPHRNTMKIFDFYATGTLEEKVNDAMFVKHSSIKERCPVIYTPVDINTPLKLTIKRTNERTVKLLLKADETTLVQSATVPVLSILDQTYIVIPPHLLKEAYDKGGKYFAMRPMTARVMTADGKLNAEYAFGAFSPGTKAGFPSCGIKKINGRTRMMINGQPQPDMLSYQQEEHGKFIADQTTGFYNSGIRLFRFLLKDWSCWNKNGEPDTDKIFREIQSAMLRLVTHAPDSRMLITWYLYVPPMYCVKYPDEAIKFDNNGKAIRHAPGKTLQPSYASEKWRKVRNEIFAKVIKKMADSPWADRVAGIQLAYANGGEWNNWGYHEGKFADFSRPMQNAFGSWLRKKYGTEVVLQKTWNQPSASFRSAVPGRKNRIGRPDYFFRNFEKEYPSVDYYKFWQEFTVDTIEYFAKYIKEKSNNKLLVGAYFGYYVGHLTGSLYHSLDSGHYGVVRYLNSPYLDFLCAPYTYRKRRISCPLNYVFSSVTLHNKLMYTEDDQRTHRSSKNHAIYGKADTLDESIEIAKRDFGLNLLKGGSYCFVDFVLGWYQDKEYLDTVRKLHEIEPVILNTPTSKPEVAVLVSESSMPYISNRAAPALFHSYYTLRKSLDQTGAPYDLFYAGDIAKIDFSGYKLVIFMNCEKLSDSQIDLMNKKVKNSQRNILMLYAPGIIGKNGIDIVRMQKVSGMKFKLIPNEKITSIKLDGVGIPLNLKLNKPFGPVIAINDASVTALGRINDKYVGVGRKKYRDFTVFYVGYTGMDSNWLRYFYKQSKVHIYLDSSDTFFANAPFYCLYTRSAGDRELLFPGKCEVIFDLYDKKELGRNSNKVRISCPSEAKTRLIYAGKRSGLTNSK